MLSITALVDLRVIENGGGSTPPLLTLSGEGVFAQDLFATRSGGQRLAETTISASQLAALAADGTISFDVTPSSRVSKNDNLLRQSLTLRLSYATEGTRAIGDFVAPAAGTYLARIAGAEASYSLLVTRGAQFGIEPNDDLATAEDLTFSTTVLGAVSPSVTKSVDRPPISEDFESGSLGDAWTTFSSTPEGRVEVTDSETSAAGDFALLMKSTRRGIINEAIWTVDLAGASGALISFFHLGFDDGSRPFGGDFVGSFGADGVAISDDGVTWHPIFNSPLTGSSWQPFVVDLAAGAAEAGMTLGPNFKIKFQHFGKGRQEQRRGYDEITLATQTLIDLPDDDFYSIQTVAGDLLQLSTSLPGGGPGQPVNNLDVAIELFAPTGVLVAIDPDGALSHLATMTGTYTVHVLGENDTAGEYILTISGHSGSPPTPGATPTGLVDDVLLSTLEERGAQDFNNTVFTTALTAFVSTLDNVTTSTESTGEPKLLTITDTEDSLPLLNLTTMKRPPVETDSDGHNRLSSEQMHDAAFAVLVEEFEMGRQGSSGRSQYLDRPTDHAIEAVGRTNGRQPVERRGHFKFWQAHALLTNRDRHVHQKGQPKIADEHREMEDGLERLLRDLGMDQVLPSLDEDLLEKLAVALAR